MLFHCGVRVLRKKYSICILNYDINRALFSPSSST